MKKLTAILLAAILTLGTLAACSEPASQSSDPAPDTETSSTADASEETPVDAEEATISYMSWQSGATKDLEEAAIAEYMELNPHITIESEFVAYNDYTSKLNTLLAADEEANIYTLQEYYTLQYGQEGIVENLTPYYNAIDIDPQEQFIPGGAAISKDGSLYGLNSIVAAFVLYYNKDLFEAHNVEMPSTDPATVWDWDQFLDAAKQLTLDVNGNNAASDSFDKDNIATYGTIAQANSWLSIMPILYSAGGSFGSEDGMSSGLTSPETIDAMTKLNDLMNVHYVAPTAALAGGMPTLEAMMANGQLAMFWGGLWAVPGLEEVGVNYGIAPIPSIQESKTISWAAHNVMSTNTENKQAAFDFLSWFSDPEQNPRVLSQGIPTDKDFLLNNPDALNEAYGEEHAGIIIDILDQTAMMPENVTLKNFAQIADQNFVPTMDKVWFGEVTPEEGLAEVEAATAELFEGRWDS